MEKKCITERPAPARGIKLIKKDGVLVSEEINGVAKDSLWRLAGASSGFTAVCALALFNDDFNENSLVGDYFGGYNDAYIARLNEDGSETCLGKSQCPMTLGHCLTGTSGIMSDELGVHQHSVRPGFSRRSLGSAAGYYVYYGMLSFEPGSRYGISEFGAFDTLGACLEKREGKKFAELLKEKVTDPLGLTSVKLSLTEEEWAKVVTLGSDDPGKHIFDNYPLECESSGAGIVASAYDLLEFGEFIRTGNESILPKAQWEKLWTPQLPADFPGLDEGKNAGLGTKLCKPDVICLKGRYGIHVRIDRAAGTTVVFCSAD